ncbi:hypothetical protein Taro_016357 [Colocasia esculenta]|uniref:NAC domain-containing protein n=1 Tax=Colocasia esculenta TaxID=4460 RepID=A0A843UNB8_COLES|nr:hypothetical protein [Colocasia esculenta]
MHAIQGSIIRSARNLHVESAMVPEINHKFIYDVYFMHAEMSGEDPEQWFFFYPRQVREAQGGRPTQTTHSGYWKATGSLTPVFHNQRIIGIRKTMVFYHGRAPTGRKTSLKMNEYRAAQEDGERAASSSSFASAASSTADVKCRSEFSLCLVYRKSGHLRSFDRRPIVRVERENPADDDGVHVLPSVITSTSPPPDHGNAAASAMTNNRYLGVPSDGQEHPAMELGDVEDCDPEELDLRFLDWLRPDLIC